MLDDSSVSRPNGRHLDPALLAFIKCHVTSVHKWHVLSALCNEPNQWFDAASLARAGRSEQDVSVALAELADEGVLTRRRAPHGETLYRLDADDPTTTVASRLVNAVARSLELRQIVVAHLAQTTASA